MSPHLSALLPALTSSTKTAQEGEGRGIGWVTTTAGTALVLAQAIMYADHFNVHRQHVVLFNIGSGAPKPVFFDMRVHQHRAGDRNLPGPPFFWVKMTPTGFRSTTS